MTEQQPVKWGVLGNANIARRAILPAIANTQTAELVALASRSGNRDEIACAKAPRFYDDYEALLQDDGVEAVYIPLPHHLHFEWCEKALHAGKHVLCEKPITLSPGAYEQLAELAARQNRILSEALMVRYQARLDLLDTLIANGSLGSVTSIHCHFSYNNPSTDNFRNRYEDGSGALWDIGCYPLYVAYKVMGGPPQRLLTTCQLHPEFKGDMLTSCIMDYGGAHASFTLGTQMIDHQSVQIHGTTGWVDIPAPFNPPTDAPGHMILHRYDTDQKPTRSNIYSPTTDQFAAMVDTISQRIIDQRGSQTSPLQSDPLTRDIQHLLQACWQSTKQGGWININ